MTNSGDSHNAARHSPAAAQAYLRIARSGRADQQRGDGVQQAPVCLPNDARRQRGEA